jgi:hypothetical protein
MKRQWDIEELVEHFLLVEEDVPLIGSKTGSSWFGYVLPLECFQQKEHIP